MTKKIPTPIAIGIILILAIVVGAGVWWYGQKNKQGCISLAVPMRNQETGECKVFSTPCDIPKSDWVGDNSCSDSLTLTFTGKMTFSPIEGGCWNFISDDGKNFELVEQKALEIENTSNILTKKIRIEGKIRKDLYSICGGGIDGFFEVKLYEILGDIELLDTSDWQTYKNEEYGYTFKYPRNWIHEIQQGSIWQRFYSTDFLSTSEYRGSDFPQMSISKGGKFIVGTQKEQGDLWKKYSFDKLNEIYGGPTNVFSTKKVMIGKDIALYRDYIQYTKDYAQLDVIFYHSNDDVIYTQLIIQCAVAEKENYQKIFNQILSTFRFIE